MTINGPHSRTGRCAEGEGDVPALSTRKSFVRNALLASLSPRDLALLGGHLEPIVLTSRIILQEPKKQVEHIYFIESGLISMRIVAAGSILEAAVVGHRGAVGVSFLVSGHLPMHQSIVVLSGTALRIRVADLRRLMSERPEIGAQITRYVEALFMHCAQTGMCGVLHDFERRLASWICLACDAIDGNVLPITHDYLSAILGMRRASVTEALIRFEKKGLVRKERGLLHVADRKGLEHVACSCRGIVADAYASAEHPREGRELLDLFDPTTNGW